MACLGAIMLVALAGERSFMITPDPGFVLVDLAYHGGMTGMSSTFTLYADGRLVSRRVSQSGEVAASREYQVEAATVDRLIETMMNAGLYESNQELLEEHMGPRRNVIRASDNSEMHLTIALDRYQSSDDAEPREVRTSFVSQHPFLISKHFKDVAEMQCFEAIAHFFRDYPATQGKR